MSIFKKDIGRLRLSISPPFPRKIDIEVSDRPDQSLWRLSMEEARDLVYGLVALMALAEEEDGEAVCAESAPVVPSAIEELWEKEEAARAASTGITSALAGEEPQPANLEPLLDDAWEQRVIERHRGIAERDSIGKENTGHLETMASLLDLVGEKVSDASNYIRHELTKRMKGDRDADAADRP